MSLLIQHLRLVPAPAWPLSIGLVLNSAILFGNLGASLTGAVPIAREQLGVSGLKKKEKVRIWALFYKKAASYIVPSILTSTALHLLSAYLTPSPRIRNFSLTAAASALSIIPYTLLVIMPTNKALLAMDEKNELTPAEESDVPYLLGKWNSLHGGRYLSYVVSWVAGLGGLMGVVGGW